MGQCYVGDVDTKQFICMVSTGSLVKPNKRKTELRRDIECCVECGEPYNLKSCGDKHTRIQELQRLSIWYVNGAKKQ